MTVQREVISLLRRLESETADGRKAAYDELFELVYGDLRVRRGGSSYATGAQSRCSPRRSSTKPTDDSSSRNELRRPRTFHECCGQRDASSSIERAQPEGREALGTPTARIADDETVMVTFSEYPAQLIIHQHETLKPEQIRLVELRYFFELSEERRRS